jgi:hypothetical protein
MHGETVKLILYVFNVLILCTSGNNKTILKQNFMKIRKTVD